MSIILSRDIGTRKTSLIQFIHRRTTRGQEGRFSLPFLENWKKFPLSLEEKSVIIPCGTFHSCAVDEMFIEMLIYLSFCIFLFFFFIFVNSLTIKFWRLYEIGKLKFTLVTSSAVASWIVIMLKVSNQV